MTLVGRREVLKLGSASALAMMVPARPSLAAARAVLPAAPAPALVLADLRYGDSLGFARGAARQGAEIVPLARNLGEIWFETVAPRLPGLQVLAGLTLDSDLFVLTRLAEGSGAATAFAGTHDWRSGPRSAHTLNGALPLEEMSASLVRGEGDWAELLGSALLKANWRDPEPYGPKRIARFQLSQPRAADCPGYFVSWLLRWTPQANETS